MNSGPRDQTGQAIVELALVAVLFGFFILGVLQVVMIGAAQIRCQQAARYAAWSRNVMNTAEMDWSRDRVQAILPGCRVSDRPVSGNREQGAVYEVAYHVPAIGYFHWFRPQGFEIKSRSGVIAYNPKADYQKTLDSVKKKAAELFGL